MRFCDRMTDMTENTTQPNNTANENRPTPRHSIGVWVLLAAVLLALAIGAYLRYGRGVHFDEEFASQTYEGVTTYYLNSSNHSNTSIIYLHDGKDSAVISDQTWRRLNRIANETDAEIITSDPAATSAVTDEEVYEFLCRWYAPWQQGNASRLIYVMGDAQDSPFVEGFLDYLREQGVPLPNGQVSIDDITEILAEQDAE